MGNDLRKWIRLVEGDKPPEFLYHATSTDNIPSIIKHGLQPIIDSSIDAKIKQPVVFASPSLQYTYGYGGIDEAILQIDTSGNEWIKISRMEMITLTPVLPQYLKILKDETSYIDGRRFSEKTFVPLVMPLFEMTFDRKVAEQKFRGREETITEHIVKLLAFDVSEQTRIVWKKEVRNHLLYLAGLRLRNQKPAPRETIWKWLYVDPISGNEIATVNSYIMMHEDDYVRNTLTVQQIADRIKTLYVEFVNNLAIGKGSSEIVSSL